MNRLGGLGPTPTGGEVDDERDMRAQDAVTLRDAFAMSAHQAVIADSTAYSKELTRQGKGDVDLSEFLAKLAYRHADAMLKARQQ